MRILMILGRCPVPPLKGDQVRAYHLVQELSRRGHDVVVLCLSPRKPPVREIQKIAAEVRVVDTNVARQLIRALRAFVSGRPAQVGYVESRRMREAIVREVNAGTFDVALVQLSRMAQYVDLLATTKPVVVDLVDSLSLNARLRAQLARGPARWFWSRESQRMMEIERHLTREADSSILVSARDAEFIGEQDSRLCVVPNGVSLDSFRFALEGRNEGELIFHGNMSYFANEDAARFLVREVLPEIWGQGRMVYTQIVGANPSRAVRALQNDRVRVVGWVPEIGPYLRRATIGIFPLRVATGIQNKVLEAMASGLPVVTTPVVASAIGAVDGVHVVIGASSSELARGVIRLLDSAELRERIALQARAFVEENFTWAAAGERVERILKEVCSAGPENYT